MKHLAAFFRPRGRHRTDPDMSVIAEQITAGDAEPGEFRYCTEELRQTYHAMHADGSRRCWTCNTETPAGA